MPVVLLGAFWFLQTAGSMCAGPGFRDGFWKMVAERESGCMVKAVQVGWWWAEPLGLSSSGASPDWLYLWPPFSLPRREWVEHTIGRQLLSRVGWVLSQAAPWLPTPQSQPQRSWGL